MGPHDGGSHSLTGGTDVYKEYTVVYAENNYQFPSACYVSNVNFELLDGLFTTNIYKFTPAETGNYEYTSECSNRGECDGGAGTCSCYKGYTNYNCDEQSALAV